MLLTLATARSRVILMIDSADHVTGKTGLTLTVKASKDGAAFATITPTVTELESGFYELALTGTHTDTLGDLALHVTSAGADPTDVVDQVIAAAPGTLTSGERADLAAALLDLADAIETGLTPRGALRLALAALAGKLSGAGGTTVTIRNAVADSKDRIVATVDSLGDRTAIVTDVS